MGDTVENMLELLQTPFLDTMFGIAMLVFASSVVARWGWMLGGWIVDMFSKDG
jgi:hypothetical protein